MDGSLHIRLEGADDTLEEHIARCEQVTKLLGRGWRERVRGSELIASLAGAQARVSRARTACAMVGPQPEVTALLERVAAAEEELLTATDEALRWCEVPLHGSLHQKLSRLRALAEPIERGPDEHVLFVFPSDGGTVTVTTMREYFEGDNRRLVLERSKSIATPKRGHLELALRLRDAFAVSAQPRRELGPAAVVEVFRYGGNGSTAGHLLAWRNGLLFLPRQKTGDLLTALLKPTRDESAVPVPEADVLVLLGQLLPWIEHELVVRIEDQGLDWHWARRDAVLIGSMVHHQRFEQPAYRVVNVEGLEILSRTLDLT